MSKLAAFIIVFVALVIGHAQEPPIMQHTQTISLEDVQGRIDHFGVDPQRKRLYMAALGNNSVEVIDLAAGKRIESIKGMKKPTGVRVLAGSGNFVVASGDDGK